MNKDDIINYLKTIRKPQFSKVMLLIILIYIGRVIEFSLNMMEITHDLSPLSYLLPAVIGVGGTIVNYYYWKSKNENVEKIKNNPDYDDPMILNEDYEDYEDY